MVQRRAEASGSGGGATFARWTGFVRAGLSTWSAAKERHTNAQRMVPTLLSLAALGAGGAVPSARASGERGPLRGSLTATIDVKEPRELRRTPPVRSGAMPLTVAVVQPATVALDVAANARAHARAIRQAAARLVVFPELSLVGYELDAPVLAADDPRLAPIAGACAQTGAVALAGAVVDGPAIGVLRIDGDGAAVAYRKSYLGGEEAGRFVPGDGVGEIAVDGWRIAVGVCKDTGTAEHVARAARLRPDLYVAGLVHHDHELDEQDRRAARIATATGAPVAFASFAGPTGGGYATTAGHSAIYGRDGVVLSRASGAPGDVARAELPHYTS